MKRVYRITLHLIVRQPPMSLLFRHVGRSRECGKMAPHKSVSKRNMWKLCVRVSKGLPAAWHVSCLSSGGHRRSSSESHRPGFWQCQRVVCVGSRDDLVARFVRTLDRTARGLHGFCFMFRERGGICQLVECPGQVSFGEGGVDNQWCKQGFI